MLNLMECYQAPKPYFEAFLYYDTHHLIDSMYAGLMREAPNIHLQPYEMSVPHHLFVNTLQDKAILEHILQDSLGLVLNRGVRGREAFL